MATSGQARVRAERYRQARDRVRWKFMVLIGCLAIVGSLASYARQPQAVQPKRVGVLALAPCPLQPDNKVVRRLAELGWVEGRNFVFDCVSTVDRLEQVPELAHELVLRRPDVLIAGPYTYVMALKRETTTIPIIMLGTWQPVRLGLATSLARPEGNVTGVAWFSLLSKQMELLREIVPNLRRVALIEAATPTLATLAPEVTKIGELRNKTVASTLGFTWQVFQPAAANDYDEIFAHLAAEHFDAAYIGGDALANQNWSRICQLALRHLIPTVGDSAGWANCGLLLSYGQDYPWTEARASDYVDKILRGAKPSDLPVEQGTKFQLVINLKTAKTLGLTVPPSLIARADELIE